LHLFELATFADFQNRAVAQIAENGIIVMAFSTGKFINPQKAVNACVNVALPTFW